MNNKKWTIVVVSAAVLISATYWFFVRGQGQNATSFREVAVTRGDITLQVLATGTVQPANRLEIKPPIAGRVEKVLVKEGEAVRKGQLLAWMSSTERAAMLDAARSQGPEELKKWEELYRPTPVIAPINGTIILRNVESGQTFTNSEPIMVMSDRLTVKAQVDETDIASIKLKQDAQIILDAYADKQIPAIVEQIAYEAKTVNNVTTYTVDVLPSNTPDFMRAGMTANVTFQTDSRQQVLLLPTEAVKFDKNKTTVMIKKSGNSSVSEERNISIGLNDGKQLEVKEGLQEGDVVLVAQFNNSADKKSRSGNPLMPGARGGGGKR